MNRRVLSIDVDRRKLDCPAATRNTDLSDGSPSGTGMKKGMVAYRRGTDRTSTMHSCARERENERNSLGRDGGEGQRCNKFRAGKNGTVGYERLMERRAKVRARKAAR